MTEIIFWTNVAFGVGFAAGGGLTFLTMRRAIDRHLKKLSRRQDVLIAAHLYKSRPRWMP